MKRTTIFTVGVLGSLGFCGLVLLTGFYTVQPGFRGIEVRLGKADPAIQTEGLHWTLPLVTGVQRLSIRQQTQELPAEAFSSDLQHVAVQLQVLYSLPESALFDVFCKYAGDPFTSLVAPRVQEALKEVTASQTAEGIAKNREKVKQHTLELAREKVGEIVTIRDIVIENVSLSKELEVAIESKMVQEQEAAKSRFIQQRAEIEARTTVLRAQADAEAISVRGKALKDNAGVVELMLLEKWNGVAPQVVAGVSGPQLVLPISK